MAEKFLGNMVDTNTNFVLEPCVLGGLCDGRAGRTTEPAVVEGAPPVPMIVRELGDPRSTARRPTARHRASTSLPGARRRAQSTPTSWSRRRSPSRSPASTPAASRSPTPTGERVPASVDQIGPGTFGLFPHRVLLQPGATYTARLAAGTCDAAGNRTPEERCWTFTVAPDAEHATGNTAVAAGFSIPSQSVVLSQTTKRKSKSAKGKRHGHL